jgi:RHS repeat-associated protein
VDAAGAVVSRFVYGSSSQAPLYIERDGDIYVFVTDHLGSVRDVVRASDGVVMQALSYDAWGKVTSDTSPGFQPFGFAGGIYDSDTGLVRFGAREYDASAGRWTRKDPIRFAGRDTNLFAYAAGDPINGRDPRGLQGIPANRMASFPDDPGPAPSEDHSWGPWANGDPASERSQQCPVPDDSEPLHGEDFPACTSCVLLLGSLLLAEGEVVFHGAKLVKFAAGAYEVFGLGHAVVDGAEEHSASGPPDE